MNVHILPDEAAIERIGASPETLRKVMSNIADGTDTSDLTVHAYFVAADGLWGGQSITRGPIRMHSSTRRSGAWSFMQRLQTQADIPAEHNLIRLRFGTRGVHYPLRGMDTYGWKWCWGSIEAHVGELFAHELFHYRCTHLGLHRGHRKERAANMWAFARAQSIGLPVACRPNARRVRSSPCRRAFTSRAKLAANPRLLGRVKMSAAHLSADDLLELTMWCFDREERLTLGRAEEGTAGSGDPDDSSHNGRRSTSSVTCQSGVSSS